MHKQRSLRPEFWLPLPLLGCLFWGIASTVTNRLLQRSNPDVFEVQVTATALPKTPELVSIKVDIYQSREVSEITLTSASRDVIVQTLELPSTNTQTIEATIAQKFNLPLALIQRRVQYHERD